MLAIASVLACMVIITVDVCVMSARRDIIDDYFFHNSSLAVVVMAFATFFALNSSAMKKAIAGSRISKSALSSVAKSTYGVYLMHVLIMQVWIDSGLGFKTDGPMAHPLIVVPATTIVVFAICMVIALLLRRIPVIGKLLT